MAYIPGQLLPASVAIHNGYGSICEDCNEPAVTTLVGETDSFGSEFHPLCQKHKDEYIVARDKEQEDEENNPTGCCDWCKRSHVKVRPHRDFEEGSCGPVYDVCDACIAKEQASLDDEYDDY